MAEFVKVATKDQIPAGEGRTFDLGGRPIAVFNVEGAYHAIDNTCMHAGGPLGEGQLEGSVVTCPWHGWQWDVTSGVNCVSDQMRVACFEVKVDGDDVLVAG